MSLIATFGGVVRIVLRSLRHHALSTCITIASVALASGLVMAVFSISDQSYTAFTGAGRGFDAVLGARGSQLQLVLNSVFHMDVSPGNIPWSMYTAIKQDTRVDLAIPYAVGDNYRGYRIVGTTMELFERYEPAKGEHLRLSAGRWFDPERKQAVIGSQVAQRTGLRLGDQFNSYHGLIFDETKQHPDRFEVVGILETTNGPMDRVIWIPIDCVFRMTGHELHGAGQKYVPQEGKTIPDEHKEVSAVMIKLKTKDLPAGYTMANTINRQGTVATMAFPIASVVAKVFDELGLIIQVLRVVAYLTVLVAAGSILASIYNTMNERRREFAILRAIGARRATLLSAIVLEAGTIAALGVVVGWLVYAGLLAGVGAVVYAKYGVRLMVWYPEPALARVPLIMIALGALAGVVPAIKAYATDVASHLSPVS